MSQTAQEKRRLLFVSNLFPDEGEPIRGLDNAALLHALSGDWNIRVLSPRPVFPPWKGANRSARLEDFPFEPRYVPCPYLPRIGDRWNDRMMARTLAPVFEQAVIDFKPQVVLGSWLYPDGCAVAELAERFEFPVVLITQGTDTHRYLDIPFRRRKILQAIDKSGSVVCRSGDLARRLEDSGADPLKLKVIYNGVDTGIFRKRNRNAVRRDLALDPDEPILLFVGNFLPVKDPLFLIRAHDELNRRRAESGKRPARLVMIGDGPLRKSMETEAGEPGPGSPVVLESRMPPESIARWMNAADLFCLSSRNEGFPNVILEAMACGLPVISTDVGGISELVNHPSRGQLVAPGNPNLYAAAIENGLSAGEVPALPAGNSTKAGLEHGWDRAAREYNELLASARRSGVFPGHERTGLA